ncbi:MAG: PAS domain S-box protein [Desulfococcaceae bacterium]|jgi:PAS domain S-box-containing protein|nr:PAS domain S-box protein [Desulfococcaceae bacterium]
MKLRLILLVLSLLAFLSTSAGGWLYYYSLKKAAMTEAGQQADIRLKNIRATLFFLLSEHADSVRILAGLGEIREILIKDSPLPRFRANQLVDHFRKILDADICYLMDSKGDVRVSSNRNDKDSLVGKNFSFRPYFQNALKGQTVSYFALGTASGRRGIYYSHPIYHDLSKPPLGVAVIKKSIDEIEKKISLGNTEIMLLTAPCGIIFISSRREWINKSVRQIGPDKSAELKKNLQFGQGPWERIPLNFTDSMNAENEKGTRYMLRREEITGFPGWQMLYLQNLSSISKKISAPLIRITGELILIVCILTGASLMILYRRASKEILRRRTAEKSLKESEERYRSIYHNAPAMLHSVNRETRLVSVSDNWLRIMGYTRKEVIGRRLRDFLSEESGKYLEEKVMPAFNKKGYCNDIPYCFIKKNGEVMDVLLSSYGEKDKEGNIVRSFSVSIDITERKKAEKALRKAKEELSRYSRELESEVRRRTEVLRRLSASIITGQEKERAAIARELHDELGQILTALRMDAVWLLRRIGDQDIKAGERARSMCELTDRTIEEVRRMAIQLRPGVLDDLGLVDALEWFAGEFEKRTEITCTFEHSDVPPLDDSIATTAYRIAQECLTNVARHAGADHVDILLKADKNLLHLSVRDNGSGFDTGYLEKAEGLGVAGMKERAMLVGGKVSLKSLPGKGTRVCFEVNLYE